MSARYQLNKVDLKKIGRGCLIALIGAILTYFTEVIPTIELGQYTPLVVVFWSIITNTVRKFIQQK